MIDRLHALADDVPERKRYQSIIFNRCMPEPNSGCWIWMRHINKWGYGRLGFGKYVVLAHRLSYTAHKGPIPDDLQIDHLCRNPACVNPDHLEPVTGKENVRRGLKGVLKRFCVNGHDFSDWNVYRYPSEGGHRTCKKCESIRKHKALDQRRTTYYLYREKQAKDARDRRGRLRTLKTQITCAATP